MQVLIPDKLYELIISYKLGTGQSPFSYASDTKYLIDIATFQSYGHVLLIKIFCCDIIICNSLKAKIESRLLPKGSPANFDPISILTPFGESLDFYGESNIMTLLRSQFSLEVLKWLQKGWDDSYLGVNLTLFQSPSSMNLMGSHIDFYESQRDSS